MHAFSHDEHRRQLIWYSRYDTRSTQPPSDRSRNQDTSNKSTDVNENGTTGKASAPEPPHGYKRVFSTHETSSGYKGSSMDTLDMFSELSATSEPFSGDSWAPALEVELPGPPYGIMRKLKKNYKIGDGQLEPSNIGPIVPEFLPPPSEDIADRLKERFKGKHRKYWSSLLQETERKIPTTNQPTAY